VGVSVSTREVEVEISKEELERLIRQYVPQAVLEERGGRLYVVVPVDAFVSIRYEGGKVKIVVPLPSIPGLGGKP
jgi:hypothetical protein